MSQELIDKLAAEAKRLPAEEQFELVERILSDSLDVQTPAIAPDDLNTYRQRDLEIEIGQVQSIPWEAAIAEVERRLRDRQSPS